MAGELGGISGPAYSNFSQLISESTSVTAGSGFLYSSVGGLGGGALTPQTNRVCIIGLKYPTSGIPACTVLVNGITATPIIDIGSSNSQAINTNICLQIVKVGTTDDSSGDGGYDIQIIDGNMDAGTLQTIIWQVLMPSIVPHSSVTNTNSSTSSTLVLSSVSIPANSFSVLVGGGAFFGISTVNQGYDATLDGASSQKVVTNTPFSGNVTVTWWASGIGAAVEASFVGDGT